MVPYEIVFMIGRHFENAVIQEDPAGKGVRFNADGLRLDPKTAIDEFGRLGAVLLVRRQGEGIKGLVVPKRFHEEPKTWRVNIHWYLIAATFITTMMAGYIFAMGYLELGGIGSLWLWMPGFSIGLMVVLGGHELSHKITANRHGIDATPPFFIPVPPPLFLFGTMGAVIRLKSPIPDRDALIKMGASGPIVSFLLSIPFLIAGIGLSTLVPLKSMPSGPGTFYFGDSLLTWLIQKLLFSVPEGYAINANPLFFVGWLGVVVTMLNLIPMGQLDGAHVVRSFLGPVWAQRVSFIIVGLLVVAGSLWWPGWYLWAVIGFFLARRPHPGALDEVTPITTESKVLALSLLVIFILCFLPVPLKM